MGIVGKYWIKAMRKPSRENMSGIWDFNGLRWLRPSSFAACTTGLSLGLDSLPACSSPRQMSHSSGVFYCLGTSTATWASCLHFTAMASTVSCPLRTFRQGHPYHMLLVLSSSLKLHKENREPLHSWVLHASNPSTTWMALPSLAASLELILAPSNHISKNTFIPKIRKHLRLSFCKSQLGGVWAWHAFLCSSVEQESP